MAEYGHEELIAMFKERGGMQSLGTLKGAAILAQMNMPMAEDPVAAAQPQYGLAIGLGQ